MESSLTTVTEIGQTASACVDCSYGFIAKWQQHIRDQNNWCGINMPWEQKNHRKDGYYTLNEITENGKVTNKCKY